MVKISFLAAAAAASLAVTSSAASTVVVMEERHETPQGWSIAGRAGASEQLELIFAVKQTNLDVLEVCSFVSLLLLASCLPPPLVLCLSFLRYA